MPRLQPISNNIIFQFEDELSSVKGVKQFNERTDWGFDLRTNFDHDVNAARWGLVVATGPEVVEDLEPGTRVLIEPLKWTEGVKFEDSLYWMTNEDHIFAVDVRS